MLGSLDELYFPKEQVMKKSFSRSIANQSIPTLTLLLVITCAGLLHAETVPVDLTVQSGSSVDIEVSASAQVFGSTVSASDSDRTYVSGNVIADLDISFDDINPQNTTIQTVYFTGGRLLFSDTSFTLSFGFFGQLNASASGLGGTTGTPGDPDPVIENEFDCANHTLTFDQGRFSASGSGMVGAAFDPVTYYLNEEELVVSLSAPAFITIELASMDGYLATYNIGLILPVIYEEHIYEEGTTTLSMIGNGSVNLLGTITRQTCPLFADLAGDDCYVDSADLMVFANQWLAFGDTNNCNLTADIYGQDCIVNFADFTVFAREWLVE